MAEVVESVDRVLPSSEMPSSSCAALHFFQKSDRLTRGPADLE
jgi:hypothetical protein